VSGEPVPYAALLALQELDMLIDQANHRRSSLEALAELAVLDRRLAELSAADAEAALAADGLAQRRDELDAAVAVSSARIAQIAARTEAMVASSYRDQEAMAEEIASLRRRRSELEDAELEVMEELEPLEARLAASAQERAEIDRDRVACLGRLAEGERAIDADTATRLSPFMRARRMLVQGAADRPAPDQNFSVVRRLANEAPAVNRFVDEVAAFVLRESGRAHS
jgi:predicted  nucleic acid-binding Zn-ribbon protein